MAGATVFADVIEGAARPAKVRVITMARTKVVFMGISWCIEAGERKFLDLPDDYNLSVMTGLSPLD